MSKIHLLYAVSGCRGGQRTLAVGRSTVDLPETEPLTASYTQVTLSHTHTRTLTLTSHIRIHAHTHTRHHGTRDTRRTRVCRTNLNEPQPQASTAPATPPQWTDGDSLQQSSSCKNPNGSAAVHPSLRMRLARTKDITDSVVNQSRSCCGRRTPLTRKAAGGRRVPLS